jgi:Tfp pilus assembly protein PilO
MPISGEDTMKHLSSEKRKQLILIILLTVGAMIGTAYGLIKPEFQKREKLVQARRSTERRLQQMKQTIEHADQIEAQLCETKKQLDKVEEAMASGDLYSWAINTIRQFKLGYKVEIPQFSQIDGPREMSMLAGFPYKQATITIGGSASFYEFGKFVADFENQFPYVRLLNLSLEPIQGAAGDKERLSFKMQIAALVKPTTP